METHDKSQKLILYFLMIGAAGGHTCGTELEWTQILGDRITGLFWVFVPNNIHQTTAEQYSDPN